MAVLLLAAAVAFLAFANGANDNFKGVATLYGSGTSGYRDALWLATATTLLGSGAALFLATDLIARFSGKGLGGYPGLSMVFYDHEVEPAPATLPRSLDLGLHAAKNGVPFTMSSNLFYGLDTALDAFQTNRIFDEIADISAWLRRGLRRLGYRTVAPDEHSSPAVITIELPEEFRSIDVGRRLEAMGYVLSYNSSYLLDRNWIQVCLMGEITREAVAPLLDAMGKMHPAGSR